MNFFPGFFALFITICSDVLCSTPATSMEDSSKQVENETSEIIRNDKMREIYVNCLLDRGPCSNDAADVKRLMPEAVERGCTKCSEMHKKIIEKMMLYLKAKQPEILQQVTAKFDPKGEFMKTFLSKLQNKQINSNESGQQNRQNSENQQPKPIRN